MTFGPVLRLNHNETGGSTMEKGRFILSSDSTTDFSDQYIKENQIHMLHLSYTMEGVNYSGIDGDKLTEKEFYAKMRAGFMPTTAQINPENAKTFFLELLKSGKDILHLAFSSKLSGSYSSVKLAADELMEEDPSRKIVVIDSKAASLGEGLYVHYGVKLRDEGKSMEEAAQWLLDNRDKFCHYFTVDDLHHLHRGGRVSKASAILGTMLGIKPLLHVDEEGRLIPLYKVRGRKQSLDKLVDEMEARTKNDRNEICFISHGDCLQDAEYVRDQIKKRLGIKHFLINYVGPVIGAHSGPNTIALFFIGDTKKVER